VVAEDDPAVLDILVRALGNTYTVYAAVNGSDALDLLARLPAPHAVVLDVMMPGTDGVAIARRLKDDPERRHVPVVLLTALSAPRDVVSGINAGARHYVTKPFKLVDLLAKIEKAVKAK